MKHVSESALEDHTYHATREERERYKQIWTLTWNANGTSQQLKKDTMYQLQTLPHRPAFQDPNSRNSSSIVELGSMARLVILIRFSCLGHRNMLDARVASSSATALAWSVSITRRFRPQEDGNLQVSTVGVNTTHSRSAHFPRTRIIFILHTPQDCDSNSRTVCLP